MIEIRPDPAHPQGGFALIETGGGSLGETAEVEVFDSFAARYLGPGGWQATRFAFGPYPVERRSGVDVVRVGPDIVNQLTEYQPLRLTLGPVRAELSWPDDVVPAPDTALSGGIWTASALTAPNTAETAKPAARPETPPPLPEPAPPPIPAPVPDPAPTRRTPLLLGGLLLLALIAGGVAYLLTRPGPEPAPVTSEPVASDTPPAAPAGPDCSATTLAALGGQGFAPVAARLRECGNAVTRDEALGLIEKAAQANDPAALTLFGQLYDSDSTDGALEAGLGLTFADNPARAAEYYDRAAQAGAQEAGPLLQAACQRLSTMTDTLSQSAHEDHCGS